MKAIVQDRYGDASVLRLADVPMPTIGGTGTSARWSTDASP